MDFYGDGTYSYGSGESQRYHESTSNSTYTTNAYSSVADKKQKKKNGGFKKVLKFAGCGLLFGGCAGVAMACVLAFSPVNQKTEEKQEVSEAANIKEAAEAANLTPDMSISDMCEAMKTAMTTISIDGLTGEGMTWTADGEPNKGPKAVEIVDGKYVLKE